MAINTSCSITNQSNKSLVVVNAFNSSTNVAQNSAQQGYMQQLALLAPASGSAVIAANASGTVTLEGTYVDSNGKTQPSFIFDLMLSQPASLFPVMAAGESLNFQSMGYPPITVTQAAADNMAKALAFCQNIMTSPSSKMSTDFQTAMSNAFKLGSISQIDQAMAAYFNQYPTFAGLDFPSYVAVSTWLRGFVYAWGMNGQGQPGQTYYIYSAPAQGKTGTTSEGKIVFAAKSGAPNPADPTDRNSGMTITLIDSDNNQKPLTFSSGQLMDSPGGAVALNCTFGYAGTFNGKQSDTTAWAIMAGTLLNKQVVAIPLAPESGWDKFWSSLSFEKVLSYFMEAMGLWMAIDFLKQKLTGKEKKLADDQANENEGQPPSEQQQQDAGNAGEEVGNNALAEDQNLVNDVNPGGDVQVPGNQQDFDSAVSEVRQQGSEAFEQVAQDNIGGGIDSAGTQLSELAEIEVTPSMQQAEGNLIEAQQNLESGNLPEASSGLGQVNEAVPDIVNELGNQVSEEMKAQIQEDLQAQEMAKDVGDEAVEDSENAGSGEEEPFEDATIPEV